MFSTRLRVVLAGVACGLLSLAACGSSATNAGGGAGGGNGEVSGAVAVFAAASLTETFTQIGADFEAANPGTVVRFNFSGSSTLANQINQGAPADVFVSANPANMQIIIDAGSATGLATIVVRNQLVIAVPVGNPHNVTSLADLADPELKVALCAEQVPCGAASRAALDTGGVDLTPVTLELDVKAALSKLTLGEIDAALVYRTDVAAEEAVEGVEFPESEAAINDYPMVVLNDAPNPRAARAFTEYLRSEPATAVLLEAGFQAP